MLEIGLLSREGPLILTNLIGFENLTTILSFQHSVAKMEMYEHKKFISEVMDMISKFQYSAALPRSELARKLADFCSDYHKSSFIFDLFLRVLQERCCDLIIVDEFLETCGRKLSRWVTSEGDTEMLGLFLEFSGEVKDVMFEKGCPASCEFEHDEHPMNQNLFRGSMVNIPFLLRYGLGLEYSMYFYDLMQNSVLDYLV